MKLNALILTTSIALLASAAFSTELEKKNEPATSDTKSFSTATATASGKSGKATVTIDVNGKKETREIDLGNGTEIKLFTSDDGGGASAVAVAGGALPPKIVTWLGVAPEELSEEVRAQLPLEPGTGLVVRVVMADSPAAKAGLQKNDVLVKLDDQLLTNPGQLRTLVAAKKDGDTVKLTYFRRGQQATIEAKLATHEDKPVANLELDESLLKSERPDLRRFFGGLSSKAVVLDKDGKVVAGNAPDLRETVEGIAKLLRGVGADEKSIDDATRALTETTKAISEAVRDAVVAKDEAMKGSGEIAKALEQVRDALEKVRKQAEEAVEKDREKRREKKQP